VLVLVVVLMGVDVTLICFGRDGHVAAEATTLDHHFTPSAAAQGVSPLRAHDAHGPCVDASAFTVVNDIRDAGDIDLGTVMLPPLVDLPVERVAFYEVDLASLSDLPARRTVLRL
jgi:hypothetical protein